MAKTYYITTAIPYVNAAPHIGFAMEAVQADVLARYHRMLGDTTIYQTGTDEHGIKLLKTAKEQGKTAQQLADENAARFKELVTALNLSADNFVRTTDAAHQRGAQKMWRTMDSAGDIYKGHYEGLYCVGCESYIPEKDFADGLCAIHKKPPESIKEENYFFKLSKYSAQIRALIERDELRIIPESRKNEMLNIIGEGLPDVSFSRPKENLPWGIEVPDDPTQVMYVWCDALSNYITGIGYEEDTPQFKAMWPGIHVIGKDILRFHAGIWIGMLLSANVRVPRAIHVHGFITSEGQKMSKSLGNVVDPFAYVGEFGADALRYYLMREIPTVDDGDFSRARFLSCYQGHLGNNLGNLVYRVLSMNEKYFASKVPAKTMVEPFGADAHRARFPSVHALVQQYTHAIESFDLKLALETVWSAIDFCNEYIDINKPWALAKTDLPRLAIVMYQLLEMIRIIGLLLLPFLPLASGKILTQLGQMSSISDFDQKVLWGGLSEGEPLQKGEPLFPRIDI